MLPYCVDIQRHEQKIKKIFFCIAGKKRKYIFASPLQRASSRLKR